MIENLASISAKLIRFRLSKMRLTRNVNGAVTNEITVVTDEILANTYYCISSDDIET